MEIDQLAATPISFTFRTKAFLDESDDLVFLDKPHHSFSLQHHRDGKSLSREVFNVTLCPSVREKRAS